MNGSFEHTSLNGSGLVIATYRDESRPDDGTRVSWTWCEGYLTYRVHRTPAPFQSRSFKLHEFVASNGVRVGSKNSPLFTSRSCIFLQGAFREFDYKPTVHYIETLPEFEDLVVGQIRALEELDAAVWADGYRPRVVGARDGGDYVEGPEG